MEYLYVPGSNFFMGEAEKMAKNYSTDHNWPTGSVVVKDGKIIGRGANQAALKNKWLMNFHRQYFCIRKFLKIKSGQKYWLCPGCSPASLHSEPRAIADAKKYGVTEGADLYLWGHYWCCEPCQKAIIKAGLVNVYLLEGSDKLFNKS